MQHKRPNLGARYVVYLHDSKFMPTFAILVEVLKGAIRRIKSSSMCQYAALRVERCRPYLLDQVEAVFSAYGVHKWSFVYKP